MAIRCEHSVDVSCSPAQAFALLDDLPRTPEWLATCIAIEKTAPGPNAVGDTLKYTFKQGGQTGVMDGEVRERVPDKKLACNYTDPTMKVRVEFNITSTSTGTSLTHIITITPRTFFGRLMSPLIRISLPRQTRKAMAAIKSILDSSTL
jgi:hypothetical protein